MPRTASARPVASAHPRVRLDPDRIFVEDGVWTSAGVTAGIDLALEILRRHHGSEMAADVSRHLVVDLQRAGGQRASSGSASTPPGASSNVPTTGWPAWRGAAANGRSPRSTGPSGASSASPPGEYRERFGLVPAITDRADAVDPGAPPQASASTRPSPTASSEVEKPT